MGMHNNKEQKVVDVDMNHALRLEFGRVLHRVPMQRIVAHPSWPMSLSDTRLWHIAVRSHHVEMCGIIRHCLSDVVQKLNRC